MLNIILNGGKFLEETEDKPVALPPLVPLPTPEPQTQPQTQEAK